ncbi:uncharacterized protein LOC119602624 [Lucilia sericata]|uniref:uncharacterized protein LOC119602624 n=1 Tax=Lucilia sericata TaxID=13632 RepID=UPI0018A850DD|nr:uncharacterized protein LOC119602624 [Lucilia sericata]
MKYLFIFFAILFLACCITVSNAGLFDRKEKKEKICGSNGITYINRYEFEKSQQFYKKLRRPLEMANEGACPREKRQNF